MKTLCQKTSSSVENSMQQNTNANPKCNVCGLKNRLLGGAI